jgi:hypothetical protein
MVSAILIGTLLAVAGSLYAWRRHGQQRERDREGASPSEPGTPARTTPRHDTALDELRAMREALKPAEHSRVERRRPGGSGLPLGQERRRGRPGTLRAGSARGDAADQPNP